MVVSLTQALPPQDAHGSSLQGLRLTGHGPYSRRIDPECVSTPYRFFPTSSRLLSLLLPAEPPCHSMLWLSLTLVMCVCVFYAVFETELMGIEGVPTPEKIVTKSGTDSAKVGEAASSKIAEKVASKVAEAAEVVKTIIADTDDVQEHNEL